MKNIYGGLFNIYVVTFWYTGGTMTKNLLEKLKDFEISG